MKCTLLYGSKNIFYENILLNRRPQSIDPLNEYPIAISEVLSFIKAIQVIILLCLQLYKWSVKSEVAKYRACISYRDFFDKGLLLTRKLYNQDCHVVNIKRPLRRFYEHDLSWLTVMKFTFHTR